MRVCQFRHKPVNRSISLPCSAEGGRSAAGRRVKEYIGGEIFEGTAVHIWEEKSVQMVRVASGDLVYNVPAARAGR